MKDGHLEDNFWAYLKRLLRKLVVPYLCFWIISYLYWLATHGLVSDPSRYANLTFIDLLAGLLHGTGDVDHTLYIINVDLWFFTCLFSTSLLYYGLQRIKSIKIRVITIVLLGIIVPIIPQLLGRRLTWNIELAGTAVVFFGLGHLLKGRPLPSKTILGLGMALAVPLWVVVALKNAAVDMNSMQFGTVWLFYLAAAAGIYLVVAGTQFIGDTRPTRWIGMNTIVIFPLHQLMFSIFTGIGVLVLGWPYAFKTSLAASLAFTLLAIACSYPIAIVLRRFAPFVIGEQRGDNTRAARQMVG